MAEPKLSDALKKIFAVGASGALLSEELIKNYLAESKLPKEILQSLLLNAQKSKEEITTKVSGEAIKMLSKVDWAKVASKFLEDHKISIKMELDFHRKSDKTDENSNSGELNKQKVKL
jgi:hypothetical protein